jgi:hypothetical protein
MTTLIRIGAPILNLICTIYFAMNAMYLASFFFGCTTVFLTIALIIEYDNNNRYLKPVTCDKLVVGKRYADTFILHKNTTIFEFVNHNKFGDLEFKYINGANGYIEDEEGLYSFTNNDPFYELPSNHPDYRKINK